MTLLSGVYHFFRQRGSYNPQHVKQPDSPRTDDSRQSPYFPSSDEISSSFSSSSRSRSSSFSSDEDDKAFVVTKPQNHQVVVENKTEKKGFFKRVKEYFFSFRPKMRLPSLRRRPSVPQKQSASPEFNILAVGVNLDRLIRRPEGVDPDKFKKNGF